MVSKVTLVLFEFENVGAFCFTFHSVLPKLCTVNFNAAANIKLLFFYSEGQAIWLDENIRFGKTDHCTTFNNPQLCATGDFEIRVLEVYGFVGA
jgi:TLD